jgi:hypothetical protein
MSLGWHFVGIALPGGMIVGFFLYFVGFIVLRAQGAPPSPPRAVLLVALISALLGHFIEIQFGIAMTSTRTSFWFFMAMLVVVGMRRLPEFEVTNAAEQHVKTAGSMAPLIAFALLASLILVTLTFDFVSTKRLVGDAGEGVRAIDVVIASLTSKATTDGSLPSFAMLWLFIGTFFLALVLGVTQRQQQGAHHWDELLFEIAVFMVIVLLIFFAYVFAQTLLLAKHKSFGWSGFNISSVRAVSDRNCPPGCRGAHIRASPPANQANQDCMVVEWRCHTCCGSHCRRSDRQD